jgi:hypothetical protein
MNTESVNNILSGSAMPFGSNNDFAQRNPS